MHVQKQQCLTYWWIVLQYSVNLLKRILCLQSIFGVLQRAIGKVLLCSCSDLQVPKMLFRIWALPVLIQMLAVDEIFQYFLQVEDYLNKKFAELQSPNKFKVYLGHGGKPWVSDFNHPHYMAGRRAMKTGQWVFHLALVGLKMSCSSTSRNTKEVMFAEYLVYCTHIK